MKKLRWFVILLILFSISLVVMLNCDDDDDDNDDVDDDDDDVDDGDVDDGDVDDDDVDDDDVDDDDSQADDDSQTDDDDIADEIYQECMDWLMECLDMPQDIADDHCEIPIEEDQCVMTAWEQFVECLVVLECDFSSVADFMIECLGGYTDAKRECNTCHCICYCGFGTSYIDCYPAPQCESCEAQCQASCADMGGYESSSGDC